jgi:PAS domain S-box-containing protein
LLYAVSANIGHFQAKSDKLIKSRLTSGEAQSREEVENRYRQMLESLPIAIYTCDAQGYIIEFNQAAADLWGRHPEIGKDVWCGSWKIYNTDGSELAIDSCPMAVALKYGKPVYGEEIIIERPDGSRRRIAPHPTPLFNMFGEITGAVNMLLDITEQKVFEEKTASIAAIVESSDDAIIGKTLQGIVTSWNTSAERIFGYKAEEMIGESILKLIPEDRKEEEPHILGKLKRGERVDHFETKRKTKDGRLLDISLTISPIRASNGQIIGVSKIARDITAQKVAEERIRESEERFRMAVAATKLGTWEYSPASGNLTWSDECRRIYDVPADIKPDFDLFTQLIHPDDCEFTLREINKALQPASGGDYDIQFRLLRYSDRAVRWIRSQGKVYFNEQGKPERFIGTVLDTTDERLVKEELERKVEERTKDLKEANVKLAQSNSELEQFAFVASHDLQEPLRKIQAFGDMLKAKFPDSIGEEGKDLISRMQSASLRMKTLIDSLLSFSRVSFSKDEHQEIDLSALIEGVLNDLEASIKDRNAIILVDKLYPVKGEPMQLRQLFQNLIGNALKFSKEDQTPQIKISSKLVSGKDSGIQVLSTVKDKLFQLIEVKDNGIGFEPEYSKKIFQLFQRLHGKKDYPGSGMGLSIVQKVVNNHNGYIKASSSSGEGATFQILLPKDS